MESTANLKPTFPPDSPTSPVGADSEDVSNRPRESDDAVLEEDTQSIHISDIQSAPHESSTDADWPARQSEPDGTDRVPAETSFLYRAALMAGVGTVCLLVGFLLSWVLPAQPPEVVVESVEVSAPLPKYVASAVRRNEPIAPLLPSWDLDASTVELGRELFHDPGLSRTGMVSCATCHQLEAGGDDGRVASETLDSTSTLNTPTVWNAGLNIAHSWDGRSPSLEEHMDDPQGHPHQLGNDWSQVIEYLELRERYLGRFQEHLDGPPTPDRVKAALATYMRSLISQGSRFDEWLAGDEDALGPDEFGGYYLFKKMGCITCHHGPNVGGSMFCRMQNLQAYFATEGGDQNDFGRYNVTGKESDRYVFRVPGLRNVEHTGPYFHDGSAATLDEAVTIMVEQQLGLESNAEEIRRLVAFLKSLSGDIAD